MPPCWASEAGLAWTRWGEKMFWRWLFLPPDPQARRRPVPQLLPELLSNQGSGPPRSANVADLVWTWWGEKMFWHWLFPPPDPQAPSRPGPQLLSELLLDQGSGSGLLMVTTS